MVESTLYFENHHNQSNFNLLKTVQNIWKLFNISNYS